MAITRVLDVDTKNGRAIEGQRGLPLLDLKKAADKAFRSGNRTSDIGKDGPTIHGMAVVVTRVGDLEFTYRLDAVKLDPPTEEKYRFVLSQGGRGSKAYVNESVITVGSPLLVTAEPVHPEHETYAVNGGEVAEIISLTGREHASLVGLNGMNVTYMLNRSGEPAISLTATTETSGASPASETPGAGLS